MLELRLPWPPSVNRYWRHPTRGALAGRHLISTEGRSYRAGIYQSVKARGIGACLTGRLAIRIDACPPDRRRRDLDNILKSLLDALVHARVLEDDSLIDELSVFRRPPDSPGSVFVVITQLENKA